MGFGAGLPLFGAARRLGTLRCTVAIVPPAVLGRGGVIVLASGVMRLVRLAFHRAGLSGLLGLVASAQACLLVSPLDEVADGARGDDDDVGAAGAYGGSNGGGSGNSGSGGAGNPGSGGASNPGTGGRLETANGGSIGLSGSGGTQGVGASGPGGGTGGTTSSPTDVASWCPDPVALMAQGNPYVASFTLISTDCEGAEDPQDAVYNAGVAAAPGCTLMDERIAADVCGFDEVEICEEVLIEPSITADIEGYSRIVQLEPGGPILGVTEFYFSFYEDGVFAFECSGTYDVTYTPQFLQ